MSYFRNLEEAFGHYIEWLSLRREQGADIAASRRRVLSVLETSTRKLEKMRVPGKLAAAEPTDLDCLRALRPAGPRRLEMRLSDDALYDRILGAWLGRAAGCVLGIPCEGMPKKDIRNAAANLGMKYPPAAYWAGDPKPQHGPKDLHYGVTARKKFLAGNIDRIGADDDLVYTELGLLILEEYGPDFTPADVGKAWLKYLPVACTAEHVALENLKKGFIPPETAHRGNPYVDWIGADIRSDAWGYAAPGWPEKAAEFAWRDAVVSHEAAGVHGEMFFSAVIAAAFAVADWEEAVRIGLTEIPRGCRVAKAVKSALRRCRRDDNWDAATNGILAKYDGMSGVHTLNNAELTIAGLYYGGGDFSKTIGLMVAAGLDTDCTGATAGSIAGALVGAKRLPKKWVAPFGDKVESYIKGKKNWRSSDIAHRFVKAARRVGAS
ncbi:MAG: ADP-ribosylglycohydrolase family protein [Planctomycetes bacterium]|nr:ADP-ribosylglycohydrolase family protein [Planctomycetota bacterium]